MAKFRWHFFHALVWVVLMETCAIVPVSENLHGIENSNHVFNPSAGNAVIEGIRAVKKLVTGATKVPTSKLHRSFEKPGDFDKAVADFESLHPHGAHDFKMPAGEYGKAGRVGDRFLVVQNKGDSGKPTLTIIKIEDVSRLDGENRVSGKLTDVIIYKD